jgi:LysM repeat protein
MKFQSVFLKKAVTVLVALAILAGMVGFTATPAMAKAKCAYYHTVHYGETLYIIGLYYGLTWDKIAAANNIKKAGKIYAGETLCIPGATKSTKYGTGGPYTGGKYYYGVPTFTITSVVKGKNITIYTYNFPAHDTFNVYMGNTGTAGVGGVKIGTVSTGSGGSFSVTLKIPASLKSKSAIAVRLQSPSSGYYSYNWFYNAAH